MLPDFIEKLNYNAELIYFYFDSDLARFFGLWGKQVKNPVFFRVKSDHKIRHCEALNILWVKSFSFKWTRIFSKPIKDLKIKDSGNVAEYTQDLRDCSTF